MVSCAAELVIGDSKLVESCIMTMITNHVTISIVFDVAGHHLVQGSEGGDVWVRLFVDDGDLEGDIW